MPICLHPANPMTIPAAFEGLSGPGASDVRLGGGDRRSGIHALRLVLSGPFDRFPSLIIILGILGEALSFCLRRIDSRRKFSEPEVLLCRMPSACVRRNIEVTAAGVFSPGRSAARLTPWASTACSFSVDYPLEGSDEASSSPRPCP